MVTCGRGKAKGDAVAAAISKDTGVPVHFVAADLEKEFNLEHEWDEDGVLHFERMGVHGQLTLGRGEVTIHIHLGFLLRPFKSGLEREIHDYFDARFA